MDIAVKKLELMDWLLHIKDESKLQKLIAFKTILDEEVVAHTANGYPVTKQEYINLVQEADERIESGKFVSMEDLEESIKNW